MRACVRARLTAQPRRVVRGAEASDREALPAECGQNQPLAEESAALVDPPAAGHAVVVPTGGGGDPRVFIQEEEWEEQYGRAGGSNVV